jgi:putative intracellular protease/amidase
MNQRSKSLFLGLIVSIITFSHCVSPISSEMTSDTILNGFNVMIIVANSVGNCYYDIEEYLENFGANVATVGGTKTVMTCGNKGENRLLTANLTISEINNITEYDAIVVPSGGYWGAMINQKPLLDLLSEAYEEGLIIASFCVGTAILGAAGII